MTPVAYTKLLETIETKLAAAITLTQIEELDALFALADPQLLEFEASEDNAVEDQKTTFLTTASAKKNELYQDLRAKTTEIEEKHKAFENLPNQADADIAIYEANLREIASILTFLNAMESSEPLNAANQRIEDTKSKEKAALEKLQNDLNAKLMAAKADQAKVQTFIKNVTETMHNYLSKKSLHHFRPVRGEMSGKERLSNVGKNILQFFSAIWSNLKTVLKRAFTSYNKADETDEGPTNTRFESRKFDIAMASGLLDQFENKYSAHYEKISVVASVLSQLSKNLKWTANTTEQTGFPNSTLNQASNLGGFPILTNSLSLFSQRDKGQKSGRVNVRRELDAEVTKLTNIVTAPASSSPSV